MNYNLNKYPDTMDSKKNLKDQVEDEKFTNYSKTESETPKENTQRKSGKSFDLTAKNSKKGKKIRKGSLSPTKDK